MKALIIGAGMSGGTAAKLMLDSGIKVSVMESRQTIAGNCFDEAKGGVMLHVYGPHLFHTNDEQVWKFLSRFTKWTDYSHKVVADTRRGRIPIPWNLNSEALIGQRLTDKEIRELIFTDYSQKQWGIPWAEMPAAITGRVPTRRDNDDDRYFTDRFQGQPEEGYTKMFERMLDGVSLHLGERKDEWRRHAGKADLVIYTGKIDEYFDYCYGRLPYRSLRFEHTNARSRLPHAVINQCNKLAFTRVYDQRYFGEGLHGGRAGETIITREYPLAHDEANDPYYPMPFGDGMALYQRYKKLADAEPRTIFLGRLATYSYLDMWMAVAQVMVKLRPFIDRIRF